MTNDDVPSALASGVKDIEERVRQARQRDSRTGWNREPGPSADEKGKGAMALAFRIGSEMVAALIIGAGGGLLIDGWLGTRPWGLVILFFFGAGAGVANVYRAVGGLGYATGYQGAKKAAGDSPGPDRKDGTV